MRTGVFATNSSYLNCWVQLGLASGNVITVSFPTAQPAPIDGTHTPVLDRISEYLDTGNEVDFSDVDVALTVSTDYRAVFQTVRNIPYGTQRSITDVLERTAAVEPGDGSQHIIREALRNNPVPIIVPDHRVMGITGGTDPDVRDALRALEGLS